MDPDRWRQVADVYESALEREPTARRAFLVEACRDDSDLRREVESLLAHEHTRLVVDQDMLAVATAVGCTTALVAGPPSPLSSTAGPVPATVVIVPPDETRRTSHGSGLQVPG